MSEFFERNKNVCLTTLLGTMCGWLNPQKSSRNSFLSRHIADSSLDSVGYIGVVRQV